MNQKPNRASRARFSILDFVIILILLACAVGAALRYDLAGRLFSSSEPKEGTVSFTAEALTDSQADAFAENTQFFSDGKPFGKLVSVSSSPAVGYYENNEGVYTEYEREGLFDLTGSFTCELVRTDGGYLLNGKTYIAPGSVFPLKAGGVSVSVLILSVEAAE